LDNFRKEVWRVGANSIVYYIVLKYRLTNAFSSWFGAADSAPKTNMEDSMLADKPEIYAKLVETIKKNGASGPNSFYLNHDANNAYAKKAVNGGILDMPVLFIGARWDSVCNTAVSKLAEPMRKSCSNLTEVCIEAGHHVAMDKPWETNAAITRWLVTKLPSHFPGYWSIPFVSTPKI